MVHFYNVVWRHGNKCLKLLKGLVMVKWLKMSKCSYWMTWATWISDSAIVLYYNYLLCCCFLLCLANSQNGTQYKILMIWYIVMWINFHCQYTLLQNCLVVSFYCDLFLVGLDKHPISCKSPHDWRAVFSSELATFCNTIITTRPQLKPYSYVAMQIFQSSKPTIPIEALVILKKTI